MMRFLLAVALVFLCAIIASAQHTTRVEDVPVPQEQWDANKITPPKLIYGELLDYPVEAAFQQIDGLCLLTLVVDTHGNPQDIRVFHCTDSSFEGTSLDAAKQYRFKPATTEDGKPISVQVRLMHHYHAVKYFLSLHMIVDWPIIPDKRLILDRRMSKSEARHAFGMPIHYGFLPQGDGPAVPDAEGVYTQTRSVTGPRVIKFDDKGYGRMAFFREGDSECDVRLTVNEKGKATDPQVVQCGTPELQKAAVASLLKSSYKPGYVRGKEVAMRGVIHLNYGDVKDTGAAE